MSDRLTVRLISRLARASARKRAYTPAETNAETITHRNARHAMTTRGDAGRDPSPGRRVDPGLRR